MWKKDREGNRAAKAAAIRKQQAARERTRRLLIAMAVVVVLVVIVVGGVLLSGGDKVAAHPGTAPQAAASGEALVVGNPDAKVKVVVYEDFLCPYCREFESASRDFLRVDAAEGKVVVEYRPFQLLPDPYSTRALTAWAAVLEKGTPAQALAFHDLLYEYQPYEAAADKPGVDELVALARKAGVRDQAVLDAIGADNPGFVSAARKSAEEADVTGTPTVVANGKALEGASSSDMASELEQLIAKG